ncbi:protein of unknown function [Georgfuchsia toluolica]|uniref:Uncharacterized protein n=1 Tax=Georgfuchsia toluolica TaxID=424218 RepID=A0A916J4B8_9PROT|nr:protein of unknown function [Georgfuchsia toluolica]
MAPRISITLVQSNDKSVSEQMEFRNCIDLDSQNGSLELKCVGIQNA